MSCEIVEMTVVHVEMPGRDVENGNRPDTRTMEGENSHSNAGTQ